MNSKFILLDFLTAAGAEGIVSALSSFMDRLTELLSRYLGYTGARVLEGVVSLLLICLITFVVYKLVKYEQGKSSSFSP